MWYVHSLAVVLILESRTTMGNRYCTMRTRRGLGQLLCCCSDPLLLRVTPCSPAGTQWKQRKSHGRLKYDAEYLQAFEDGSSKVVAGAGYPSIPIHFKSFQFSSALAPTPPHKYPFFPLPVPLRNFPSLHYDPFKHLPSHITHQHRKEPKIKMNHHHLHTYPHAVAAAGSTGDTPNTISDFRNLLFTNPQSKFVVLVVGVLSFFQTIYLVYLVCTCLSILKRRDMAPCEDCDLCAECGRATLKMFEWEGAKKKKLA
ncbi:hypothetical protein BZA05DRAFT_232435 [Tricharina praecox]|uniref:uncharacterized protein n=1 Tax=Tricharina praecox TaxID=43433 RepID=UPI00221F38F1|nr:uncharacterized protein BZA05DRAFT_232435 [Tricharina praecox]KAI5855190.1 hypothetical protein BZA05DRAFT_232435 [Tricharina praecox]